MMNIKKKMVKRSKNNQEDSTMYSKDFGEIMGKLWDTLGDKEGHEISELLSNLERKITSDNKKKRDVIRDLVDDARKAYRPIRRQVDEVSDKLTAIGKQLRY